VKVYTPLAQCSQFAALKLKQKIITLDLFHIDLHNLLHIFIVAFGIFTKMQQQKNTVSKMFYEIEGHIGRDLIPFLHRESF
jgi:hypothetical protein